MAHSAVRGICMDKQGYLEIVKDVVEDYDKA
jgi:hypothetical protein